MRTYEGRGHMGEVRGYWRGDKRGGHMVEVRGYVIWVR